ncbi:MAG: hypothetical protein OHK0023_26570 [Anaerolineae bacterium]
MPLPIVECVPNFSEGRRPEVVQAIAEAIEGAAPVKILNQSSDFDHNRTVITFIGTPEAAVEAMFAGIAKAAEQIDLNVQRGQHPRIGAADVVPFIPIRGVSMEECVSLARRLGERVGRELNLPVYFYEAAATRPDRVQLEDVRRGEYEELKKSIGIDPDRTPDFGPAELGSAGAVIIGARPPLIAFNVYLNTNDVEIAKEIAKAVRHSSGGLRYVKALGLLVDGKAQVSMNLTDYTKTPIYRVVELIRQEAARRGVGIRSSELVGMIPEEALVDAARWYLQLDSFDMSQILERQIAEIPEEALLPVHETQLEANVELAASYGDDVKEAPLDDPLASSVPHELTQRAALPSLGTRATYFDADATKFVKAVSTASPVPGGGAVAALAGALSSALNEMVAQITSKSRRYAAVQAEMAKLAERAASLRRALNDLISRDTRAYLAVMDAYKLPEHTLNREGVIQMALKAATETPLEVMRYSVESLRLARTIADKGLANAASDVGVAAHMALAACEGAALNIRVNVLLITDKSRAESLQSQGLQYLAEARALHADTLVLVETRAKLR